MKVVLDTNVIVSRHISTRGARARIYEWWEQRRLDVLVSAAVLSEYADVLSRPSIQCHTRMSGDDVQELIAEVAAFVLCVEPEHDVVRTSVDPGDDIFLESALAGSADYVVSGDRHLLVPETVHGIPIVTPALFAAILAHEGDE